MVRRLTALLALAMATQADAATYYLGPSGNNGNTGLSEAQAWATIAYALGASSAFTGGDTLIVLDGDFGSDSPDNVQPVSGKDGSPGDWTYIIADTNATPIFDATTLTISDFDRALFFNNRSRYVVKGITFQDYPDDDTNLGGDDGSGTVAVFSNSGGIVGIHVIDCVFEAEDADSIDTPIAILTNDGAGVDYVDSCLVSGNTATNVGSAGMILGDARNAIIRGNTIRRNYAWMKFTHESPNGIQFTKSTGDDWVIEDNVISGFDHGAELRGQGGIFRRNIIHDLTDDFIWVSPQATETDAILIEDNLLYHGMDDGIEIDGTNIIVRHNTIARAGDWLLTIEEDGIEVYGNIFINSEGQPAPESGPGQRGVFVGTGSTGMAVFGNVFYDPGGTLTFDHQDDGTVTNLATFESGGYGTGNVEADPALIDTTRAASRPFYAGVNLRPKAGGAAEGFGWLGRSSGALPASGLPWFVLRTAGFSPDSLNLSIVDQLGTETLRYDGAIYERDRGQVWIADYDPDSTATGVVNGEWRVFEDGVDDRYILDSFGVQSLGEIADSVDAELADDFAGITVSSVDSIRAVGTAWLVDSTRVAGSVDSVTTALLGTGDALANFAITDSATAAPITNVHLIVYRTDTVPDSKVVDVVVDGSTHYGLLVSKKPYDYRAWKPGFFQERTGTLTASHPVSGATYNIALTAIPSTAPAASDEVTMEFFTGDLLNGALIDSMEVFIRPLGRRPRTTTGGIWIPETWRSVGFTDANGRVSWTQYESGEITAGGADETRQKWGLKAVDMRSPKLWADVRIAVYTAPDGAGGTANVADNID